MEKSMARRIKRRRPKISPRNIYSSNVNPSMTHKSIWLKFPKCHQSFKCLNLPATFRGPWVIWSELRWRRRPQNRLQIPLFSKSSDIHNTRKTPRVKTSSHCTASSGSNLNPLGKFGNPQSYSFLIVSHLTIHRRLFYLGFKIMTSRWILELVDLLCYIWCLILC